MLLLLLLCWQFNVFQQAYELYDGFVVLHGTDTLAYTASALSFMFENLGKTIIITGAQVINYFYYYIILKMVWTLWTMLIVINLYVPIVLFANHCSFTNFGRVTIDYSHRYFIYSLVKTTWSVSDLEKSHSYMYMDKINVYIVLNKIFKMLGVLKKIIY